MSALDARIAVTFFPDEKARTKSEESLSLRQLAQIIREQSAPEKSRLPWLKLARYGTNQSNKGSLRHDENVVAATGLELDNDGGPWSIDDAAQFFRDHGIGALLYESPSAAVKENRWRALLPFSREMHRKARSNVLEELALHIPGLDLKPSRGLSTAFLYGAAGNWTPRTILVDGKHVDRVQLPQAAQDATAERDESGSGILFRLARECVFGMNRADFAEEAWANDESAAHLDNQKDPERALDRAWAKALIHRAARENKIIGEKFDAFLRALKANGEIRKTLKAHEIARAAEREWEAAPDSSFDDEEHEDGGAPKRQFLTTAELKAIPRPHDFVEGLLYEGCMSVWAGKPKTGKSYLLMSVAHAVACGGVWAGREVDQGAVLIIPLEGVGMLYDRVRAWELETGKKSTLFFSPSPLNLLNGKRDLKEIIDFVRKHKCKLVILDTMARAMAGAKESSFEDMSRAIAALDRIKDETGAHVAVVHHEGYSRSGPRGSSDIVAAPDLVVEITRTKGADARMARITENRHGTDGECLNFTLVPKTLDYKNARGKPIECATVKLSGEWFEDESEKEGEMKLTDAEKAALRILRGPAMLGPLPRREAGELLRRRGWGPQKGKDSTWRTAFGRALKSLESKGEIEIDSNDALEIAG